MKKFNWNLFLKIIIIIWVIFILLIFIIDFNFKKNNNTSNIETINLNIYSKSLDMNLEGINNKENDSEFSYKNENNIIESKPYYPITDNDRYIIEHIIAGEAGHESFIGKMAVAQCILNAMKKDNLSLEEVRKQYQYTGWSPKNFETDYPEAWNDVCYAVECVFDYGLTVVEDNILWYYSPEWMPNNISHFHESQRFVIEIGGHRFFAPLD